MALRENRMSFIGFRAFFVDSSTLADGVSLGVHIDWLRYRIDIHIWNRTFSFGRVPIWNSSQWGDLAASGNWHDRNVDDWIVGNDTEPYLGPRLKLPLLNKEKRDGF